MDLYNPLFDLIENPEEYGLMETSILCNKLNPAICTADAYDYLFWDSDHPTDKAYKILVSLFLQKEQQQSRNNFKMQFPSLRKGFPGQVATGRFCNGKVPSDLIAKAFGVKDTMSAYLDPKLKDKDLPTGVCFASGGSGLDDLTARIQIS
ncbi:GDSL esterase/lipase EXL3-like isoform X2 [Tripterygium wilfordii]|uniref:GDSL esterase/lipase EXL3-like isoform X2 n=1 Tax=Tripterygium wilfordii TaxID=458696 RepID=UPI0018F812E8|nr:GDSL esterase/lipase EXL3-like isoform X2 [Tripterygium wilfordii]